MVNLYTSGIRHIPMTLPVASALAEYMLELGSYSPQFKVGFMSNNPALYDILAQVKQYIRMRWYLRSGPATTNQ
jgi:arylsulfatase